MKGYTLINNLFLYPTPVGAYYAVSLTEENQYRRFLKNLLKQSVTPSLNTKNLMSLMSIDNTEEALDVLHHCQELGWVQGVDKAIHYPQGSLDQILPQLLNNISESGKVLLADEQGFNLAYSGFSSDSAEELSAISAEISIIQQRRSDILMNDLGLKSHAWAVVDAFGNSQTGFWPIFIGENQFVISISGIPHLNQPDLVTLIWVLSIHYA